MTASTNLAPSDPNDTYDIVPTHLAVQAMRDNGYKNAAYAIAELMDNAIQAGATQVELLCAEKDGLAAAKTRRRVEQIAVLDNGEGMTADVLRMALQFGNGMRLNPAAQNGMGKFGMGLPSSSISQCTRVDVWTWQDGVEGAIHTCLDLFDIRERKITSVPIPEAKPIPDVWLRLGEKWGSSGTLVVWSNLDRCRWSRASSLFNNTEEVIGRMYRTFLNSGRVRIRFAAGNIDESLAPVTLSDYALPNDPGYLMDVTSCPTPFDRNAMFEPWGEHGHEKTLQISFNNRKHPVHLRFSIAKHEARSIPQAGATAYGKHAKSNVGVSLVRAGRELDLDQSFVTQYNPVERWWGVEVDFPPGLDEVFGVTNNKQSARHFSNMARLNLDELLQQEGVSLHALRDEMSENDDPRMHLVDIARDISNELSKMRAHLALQTKGTGTSRAPTGGAESETTAEKTERRRGEVKAETVATEQTARRKEEGATGDSDKGESQPAEVRQQQIEAALTEAGATPREAAYQPRLAVDTGIKYVFGHADIDTHGFFSVRSAGGAVIITLNTTHPAYPSLIEVLEELEVPNDGSDSDGPASLTLEDRLLRARDGLKLLLMAWARYEDEQLAGPRKQAAKDARNDWGRVARSFLALEE